jgi:FtsP/CotA-like multicopper oxidase with cupredoxin domain
VSAPTGRRWALGPRAIAIGMISLLAPVGAIALRVNVAGGDTGGMAAHSPDDTATPADSDTDMPDHSASSDAGTAAMEAVDKERIRFRAAPGDRGNEVLEPVLDADVKTFELVASIIEWRILAGQPVAAYAFNRQVPGPQIRVRQGDRLRINVTNALPEPTSVHWHGLSVPNEMDGAAGITQEPIEPGDTFTYEFTVEQAGTYFYHSHSQPDRQQALGLYGALIVDPADPAVDRTYDYDRDVVVMLQEWLQRDGNTFPAMIADGMLPNFFTINGKAYPDTEKIRMKVGDRARIRFIGSNNNFTHPMHIHGGPFRIVQTDGNPVQPSAQIDKDTINVGPRLTLDSRRINVVRARLMVQAINRHGGDATNVMLPDLGIRGNTHFPMSDLNNGTIADLLSQFLKEKGLDGK